jgi:triosephosphate isomerase
METPFIYIANWKMNKSFQDALDFCTEYKDQLHKLTQKKATTVILCPSFPALFPMIQQLEKTGIYVGAQNCSQYQNGAFTGQVDALSLAQTGCSYCIIGHSEQRRMFQESNDTIAEKMVRILENNMTPIICIGETKEQFENKETYHILEAQLESICQKLTQYTNTSCLIAYEPVWSIGTGIIPQMDYLQEVFAWLNSHIKEYAPQANFHTIYGGSVMQENIAELKLIPHIDGFLIGGASLDFQKLQNIVEYT